MPDDNKPIPVPPEDWTEEEEEAFRELTKKEQK